MLNFYIITTANIIYYMITMHVLHIIIIPCIAADCIGASSCTECANVSTTSDFECGWCPALSRLAISIIMTVLVHFGNVMCVL